MHYFALFSRILTPLALIGWLCWMPLSSSDIPKNWDPGCPELSGTWVECDLDPNKQETVTARLWYLDASRLLQIENATRFTSSNMATESRIAILDPATGSRVQQSAWMPGQAHYWPGIELASTYYDMTAHTFRLAHWDIDTLTEFQVLTLPEDHWKSQLGDYGISGFQFKPALNGAWQLLASHQMTPGKILVRGLQLDAHGDFKSIAWESDPALEIYTASDPAQPPFRVTLQREYGNVVMLPNDPLSGWPDDRDINATPAPIDWTRAPRFGHIAVPLTATAYNMESDDEGHRVRSLLTAPLGVTDAPFPAGNLLLRGSYLAGQLRTQVWNLLYDTPYLEFGMVSTMRLEEVRLIDEDRGINCVVDLNTRIALQRQGWCVWYSENPWDPAADPRLPMADGAYLQLPFKAIPLTNDRLLILHTLLDQTTEFEAPTQRIRLGLVDNNQLAWLGWVDGNTNPYDFFGSGSGESLARIGDRLLLIRAGSRSYGQDEYAAPSTWISLPLPPELADLPEGPL